MTNIPSQTFLDSARDEAAMKGSFFNVMLQLFAEYLGGSAITTLTIVSGTITPTVATHAVDTENSASTDDLTNISTTNAPAGRIIIIRAANAGRSVVLKHNSGGTGQLLLRDGTDVTLSDIMTTIWFQLQGTNWVEINRSGPAVYNLLDAVTTVEDAQDTLALTPGEDVEIYDPDILRADLADAIAAGIGFGNTASATSNPPNPLQGQMQNLVLTAPHQLSLMTVPGFVSLRVTGAFALTFATGWQVTGAYDTTKAEATVDCKFDGSTSWAWITNKVT